MTATTQPSLPPSHDAAVQQAESPAPPIMDRPKSLAATTALALGAVGVVYLAATHGVKQAGLFALGIGLGVALFHARFGFTSAWRQLVAVGQGRGLRAHTVLLGTTATLFAIIISTGIGFGGVVPEASVDPIGVGSMVGALLFGIGMQLGGGCASGVLYHVGSGQSATVITLVSFVVGSFAGTWRYDFWQETLPSFGSYSLAEDIGYGGALVVTLLVLAAIAGASLLVERRRTPPPVAPVPTAQGLARVVRGSWPMWAGGVVLAVLGALVLMTKGSAWGVTSAFALWGAKVAQALGMHPETWAYWQDPGNAADLNGALLDHSTTLNDLGIIVGAALAAAIGGQFVIQRRIPGRVVAAAILGGFLMGYGARLSFGCNIGAYLAGIASFSLSGWVWAVVALVGTWLGLKVRRRMGLATPAPGDGVC
ncbi:YeeE/YedE family protein [Janibacter corallicola]|uniref:YeeE/YedE family protein n=1 Tax=Janibacter corallicola TaxID=415212 RepID=UPI00082D7479|nr:YeeE/YedE family protein [Janibacter corallicola]